MKMKHTLSLITLSLSAILACLSSSCTTSTDTPLSATGLAQGLKSQTATSAFAHAKQLQTAGKTNAAIKKYQLIANKYPLSAEAPQARYQEASILYATGELLDSFDAFQKLIEKYNSSPLYGTALQKQSEVALAAANGDIKHNFAGIKSQLAGNNVQQMLTKVRDNAPFSKQAPKAQFAIGSLWHKRGEYNKAIAGYKGVQEKYPNNSLTPEALYRTGNIILNQSKKGNRNKASLDSAKNIFLDLQQQYPNHPRAKDAKAQLAALNKSNIQRNFEIAEFYDKKGQTASAIFYYREVLRTTPSGPIRQKAQQRLAQIGQ